MAPEFGVGHRILIEGFGLAEGSLKAYQGPFKGLLKRDLEASLKEPIGLRV